MANAPIEESSRVDCALTRKRRSRFPGCAVAQGPRRVEAAIVRAALAVESAPGSAPSPPLVGVFPGAKADRPPQLAVSLRCPQFYVALFWLAAAVVFLAAERGLHPSRAIFIISSRMIGSSVISAILRHSLA